MASSLEENDDNQFLTKAVAMNSSCDAKGMTSLLTEQLYFWDKINQRVVDFSSYMYVLYMIVFAL